MEDTRALAVMSTDEVMTIGQVLAKSGYFKDTTDQAQAVAKVLAGQELGVGPVASMRGITFVMGKMNLDAGLVAALIQRSGRYDYRILVHTADECKLAFYDNGKMVGESRFTMADAQAADLRGKDIWKKYPKNMLFARALTNGARWYCPGVYFGAVYSGDELTETAEPPAIIETIPDAKPVPAAATIDATTEAPPAPKPASLDNLVCNDWIGDPKRRAFFWAQVKEMGFTPAQAHEKLGVERMGMYHGDLDAALDQLRGALRGVVPEEGPSDE